MPSQKMFSTLRFRLLPRPFRERRALLPALLAVELCVLVVLAAVFVVGLPRQDDEFVVRDALLSQPDLPVGWTPVEAATYPYMTDSPLLTLLMEEETVAGAFSAFRDGRDSSAVATYVVFRPDEPLRLEFGGDSPDYDRIAPLVWETERLARQRLGEEPPELFVTATDAPAPGSLRGRTLAPPTGEGVQSDFVIFTKGSILALIVVEHPRGQEPFRPVDELAELVYSRIPDLLD